MLPADRIERVAQRSKEVLVRTENMAFEVEFDHGQRAMDRCVLRLEVSSGFSEERESE